RKGVFVYQKQFASTSHRIASRRLARAVTLLNRGSFRITMNSASLRNCIKWPDCRQVASLRARLPVSTTAFSRGPRLSKHHRRTVSPMRSLASPSRDGEESATPPADELLPASRPSELANTSFNSPPPAAPRGCATGTSLAPEPPGRTLQFRAPAA